MGEFSSIWADSNWQLFAVPFIATLLCGFYFRWVLQQGRRHATRFNHDDNKNTDQPHKTEQETPTTNAASQNDDDSNKTAQEAPTTSAASSKDTVSNKTEHEAPTKSAASYNDHASNKTALSNHNDALTDGASNNVSLKDGPLKNIDPDDDTLNDGAQNGASLNDGANHYLSIAAFSMVLGFWFSYTTLRGFPTTSPMLLDGYLPWLIAISGVFGMVLDFFKLSSNTRNSFYLLYALILSFGMGMLINGPALPTYMIIRYAVFAGIAFLIFSRMDEDHDMVHSAPVAALACLLGVLAISLIYTSRYSLFSFSLIGAVCGYITLSLFKPRLPWNATAILSIGSGIIGIMAILGLPRVSYLLPPLSLSMLCFAVPIIIRKFAPPSPKVQLAFQIALSIPLIVASGLLTYDHM